MNHVERLVGHLDNILQAADQACVFVEGMDKDMFLGDKRTQQAVIMNLFAIGEEVTKLIKRWPDFSERFPEVEWRQIRAMRNRIAHGYFDLNLDTVWDTVSTDLPELVYRIPAIRIAVCGTDSPSPLKPDNGV